MYYTTLLKVLNLGIEVEIIVERCNKRCVMSKVCYLTSDIPFKTDKEVPICNAKPYLEIPKSEKKYYADIDDCETVDLQRLIEYIRDHLKKKKGENTQNVELWCIWLGNDMDDISAKSCSIKELTEDFLSDIFSDDDNDYKETIVR